MMTQVKTRGLIGRIKRAYNTIRAIVNGQPTPHQLEEIQIAEVKENKKKYEKRKEKKQKKQRTKHLVNPTFLTGIITIVRNGVGYVAVDDTEAQEKGSDIMIRPDNVGNAFDGDRVRVLIIGENSKTGRKTGIVEEILERRQSEFYGSLKVMSGNIAFFIPDSRKNLPHFFIPPAHLNDAGNGDKVLVKMLRWEKNKGKNPVGEVVRTMHANEANDFVMNELLLSAGFPIGFDEKILQETAQLPEVIDEVEIAKRRDCRDLPTFTIDPVDAKDFDDAISFRTLDNGLYEVGVHIADVSHYVTVGSDTDKEAYKRATSVYLPDRVNPMLPEKISNELCSLRPHEDKLAFSAIFEIDAEAKVQSYWLGRTVIHSNHRFTYENAQEVLDKNEGAFNGELTLLNGLAKKLCKERMNNGAISFSSQEVRFVLDENARPISVVVKESIESMQLIEEFMLLANRTVAEYVSKIKVNGEAIPFPYRIHDEPNEEKLLPFIKFANKFGHQFDTSSPEKIAAGFNEMLDAVKGKPEQHVLEQLGVRTMSKASYGTDCIGHYGLGFEFYCHFTSPIRRYPDVQVHRIVQSCLENNPIIDKQMDAKCIHTSDRERAAMESERASNKYKQVEYMQNFVGEEFYAVISGVAGFGFWAETVEQKCEGMVHSFSSLAQYDDFKLDAEDYSLVGIRTGKTFRIGDKIHVRVLLANLEKRYLDLDWIPTEEDMAIRAQFVKAKTRGKKKKKHSREIEE